MKHFKNLIIHIFPPKRGIQNAKMLISLKKELRHGRRLKEGVLRTSAEFLIITLLLRPNLIQYNSSRLI